MRGNLALALQLDGLFPGDAADDTRTYTRSVHAGGIETFYLEAGPVDAPPVVLVHGLGATNASMLPLIPALSKDYRVLAPDLPGHGGTEATGGAHAARYLGDWLTAFLRETCDRPAVLIGNSLGGRTSLEAALNSPYEVRGLVLLCPAVAFRKLRQLVPFVRIVPDEIAALPVRIPRRIATRGLRGLFADPTRLPDAWYEAAIDEFVRVLSDPGQPARDVLGAAPRLPGRAVRRQRLLGPAARAQAAGAVRLGRRGRARAGRLRPVRGRGAAVRRERRPRDCGHVPQFEHPEQTADSREFLARCRRVSLGASERLDQLVGGGVRVGVAGDDPRGGRVEGGRAVHLRRTSA